jgi:hypothetical protein
VKIPITSNEVQWSKIEAWLQSAGKPNEQAMRQVEGVAEDVTANRRIDCVLAPFPDPGGRVVEMSVLEMNEAIAVRLRVYAQGQLYASIRPQRTA